MQPQIFISYSWKNKAIADTIDKDWETVGIKLIRDIRDLEFKQNVKTFMKRVEASDFVLLLLSKGYLESKNCMYEALALFKEPAFKEKVLPILVEDVRIDKPQERATYVHYWEEEIAKLTESIKSLKSHDNVPGIYEELDHYQKIRDTLDQFLTEVKDTVYLTWEDAKRTSYKAIFKFIGFAAEGLLERCIQITKRNSVEEKEIALDELALEFPNSKYVLFTKAMIATEEKKHRKARQTYEKIISLYPDHATAHYNLALLLADVGDAQGYELARKHYEQALQLLPTYADAHSNLGILLAHHFQQPEKAREHYESALASAPQHVGAHQNLADLLAGDFFGEPELARKHYEKVLEIDPCHAGAHNNLGILLANPYFQEAEKAKSHYERALEIDPNYAFAHNNLAFLLAGHFQDYPQARKHYEQAVALEPGYALAHLNLATLLKDHLQEPALARQHYERTLELDPQNADAHSQLAFLLKKHFKEPEKARRHYEKALEINPAQLMAHCNLANLFMNHFQEPEKAKQHYEKALALDPANASVHFNLSVLYTDCFQDLVKAREHYQLACLSDSRFKDAAADHFYGINVAGVQDKPQ